MRRVYERSIALIIHRGLKASLLEIVENPSILKFPETQSDVKTLETNIKYFGEVHRKIGGTVAFERIEYAR